MARKKNADKAAKKNANSARCDIALLVDAEAGERKSSGRFVPERSSVESYVLEALRALRVRAVVVPFDAAVATTVAELRALKPKLRRRDFR